MLNLLCDKGYFKGKRRAEAAFAAAAAANGGTVYLVKPSFIYGGEDFGLLPPRVNYGCAARLAFSRQGRLAALRTQPTVDLW